MKEIENVDVQGTASDLPHEGTIAELNTESQIIVDDDTDH